MKIIRFSQKKTVNWGVVEDNSVTILEEPPFKRIKLSRQKVSLSKVKILPPSVPEKIVCVGLNYKDHAHELGMKIPSEPVIFLKPPTALIGHNDKIIYPESVKLLDYEAELAVVIKKKAKNVLIKDADKYILGYTCLNDVTARDLQTKDGQWTRAKSFDSFCPVGPCIETDLNPSNVRVEAYLNGKCKQKSTTSSFIFSVRYLVSFISKVMTLLPGDIISTGTPPGVGRMKEDDTIEIKIEGIGTLRNFVEKL
jgi:2-keto-4-pentenoate hydratase/2-oxohepta-3-ene-1,7-dioic acid hydratase in catechol pathway